jgi:hypothetical protein
LNGKAPSTPIPTTKSFSKSSAKVDVSSSSKKNNKYLFITLAIITIVILVTVVILLFKFPDDNSNFKLANQSQEQVLNLGHKADNANKSFKSVISLLDSKEKTEQDISKNWEGIKGKEFTWHGEFVLYRERFLNDPEVRVAVKSSKLYEGINVILITPEKDKASKFKPGQSLSFTGIPYKYNSKKDGTVVVYMKDVNFH